jgi:RND family efflux transporter MFP subunit
MFYSMIVRVIKSLVTVVCLAAVVSACGRSPEIAEAAASASGGDASTPIAVAATMATKRTVPVVISATGTFVADEVFQVTPQGPGQIAETLVNVGDVVKAGQVLVRLDSRDAALRLAQARASLQQAEAQAAQSREDAERQTTLQVRGLVSRSDSSRLATQATVTEAAVAQARAQVAIAEKALDDTTIVAAFSGHVSARPVAVGEYVTPASRVATVIRIQPLKLELQVPEGPAMAVRIGMGVRVDVAAYPGISFDGKVTALNRAIDPLSRAMTVEATFANADGRMTPGMFASAQIFLPLAEPAVFVPEDALLTIADGTSHAVYVIEDDVARLQVVQPGERRDAMVRLRAGLSDGGLVAISNLNQLFDGARVTTGSPSAIDRNPADPQR